MFDRNPTRPLKASRTTLNPPNGYVLGRDDRVIVIAEDNDTYEAAPEALFTYTPGGHPVDTDHPTKPPEHILVCGWRRDVGDTV